MISMGSVWDRTAEFLSDNLGTILPIALLGIFVPAVITGNFAELRPGAAPGLAMGLGLGSLALALVTFWGQLAITALTLDPSHGRAATGVATRRFPAALLVMVVVLIAGLAASIPVGVILAASGVDVAAMAQESMPEIPAAAATAVALYVLILLPVMLWLVARLAELLPVIVGEGQALGAIARSWRLTRGVALKIAGVIILYAVVSIVANLAATTAFGAVMFLIAGRGEDGLSLATVLTTIVGGAVSTGFTVLGTAFTAKLFVALLLREEAAKAQ
jgi:hypothetical protein